MVLLHEIDLAIQQDSVSAEKIVAEETDGGR